MTFPMPPSPSGWCGQGNVWPSSHDLFHQPPIQLRHRPAVPGQQRPPADPALGRAAAGVRPRADLWCVPRGPGPHALPPPFLQVGSISGRLPGVGLCVLAFPGSLCFVAGAVHGVGTQGPGWSLPKRLPSSLTDLSGSSSPLRLPGSSQAR